MKHESLHIAEWSVSNRDQDHFYMTVIDSASRLTFVNSSFFGSFRNKSVNLKEASLLELISPADVQRFKEAVIKAAAGSSSVPVEVRMLTDGYKWVKWEISRMSTSGGQGYKFLCLGVDIGGKEQSWKYARIGDNCHSILENMNEGIIFQDQDGAVIAANHKAAEILHTTIEELYNKNDILCLWETSESNINPSDYAANPFMKALTTGESQTNILMNVITRDGRERILLWNAQPLFESGASVPTSVVSTILDMTKEKELEKEVKAREVLFTSFMDHTPHLCWITDERRNLVYGNQALLNYFQLDQRAIGQKIATLLSPCLATDLLDKIDKVFKLEQPDHSIIRSKMADGSERIFQLTLFPITGIASSPMVGGEALDITESYLARQEAQKVAERLSQVSHATTEAIWDWDMKTGQIFSNVALQLMIGSSLENVADLNWCFQCIHEEDRVEVEEKVRQAILAKAQSWEAEYRFLTAAGTFKTVHNRGFIFYESGNPCRMVGCLQDISEIKKLETQLVQQRVKQHNRVAEAIIQAQQEERARIGHELHDNVNQILSSANLYLSLLSPDCHDFIHIKGKVGEIVLMAIEEIRRLSKEMVMPDFNEEGLIGSVGHLVNDLRYAGKYDVVFTHNDKWSTELMDVNRKITLFRIIQEQTKNIIKYSQAKKIRISLYCSDNQIRLAITDDGIGFDAASTRRGLGLSNIYERTRLYNGKVILETAPGKGCTLLVNLPVLNSTI